MVVLDFIEVLVEIAPLEVVVAVVEEGLEGEGGVEVDGVFVADSELLGGC